MANKCTKRWSTSPVIREMQIKTTRNHFIPTGIAIMKIKEKPRKQEMCGNPHTWLVGRQNGRAAVENRLLVPVVKNPPCNARDIGLIPGPGRSHVPWSNKAGVPQLPSQCSGAHKSQLLKPVCPRTCAPQEEKPLQ